MAVTNVGDEGEMVDLPLEGEFDFGRCKEVQNIFFMRFSKDGAEGFVSERMKKEKVVVGRFYRGILSLQDINGTNLV